MRQGAETFFYFWALYHDIDIFLTEKGRGQEAFSDLIWIWDLAFLSDVTEKLNNLNLRLQGKGKLVSDMYAEVKAIQGKINIFVKQVTENNLAHFPCCKELMSDKDMESQFTVERYTDALNPTEPVAEGFQ